MWSVLSLVYDMSLTASFSCVPCTRGCCAVLFWCVKWIFSCWGPAVGTRIDGQLSSNHDCGCYKKLVCASADAKVSQVEHAYISFVPFFWVAHPWSRTALFPAPHVSLACLSSLRSPVETPTQRAGILEAPFRFFI